MEAEATRILIGVNESSLKGYPHPSISSRTAFEWTLAKIIRSNTAGFMLLFLHVQIPDEDGFDDMDSIYASPEDFQSMRQRDRIRGLHLLEYFVGRCHELGIRCEAWIKKGDPKEVLCSEVKRVHPDILVVGSRGLGPFQSYKSSNFLCNMRVNSLLDGYYMNRQCGCCIPRMGSLNTVGFLWGL